MRLRCTIGLVFFAVITAGLASNFSVRKAIYFNDTKPYKPALYFIHNHSDTPLWLVHHVKHPSASAGWSTQIGPKKWSSMWITTPNFQLICQNAGEINPFADIPCDKVITVKAVTICGRSRSDADGSSWVVISQDKQTLLSRVKSNGFVLCKHKR